MADPLAAWARAQVLREMIDAARYELPAAAQPVPGAPHAQRMLRLDWYSATVLNRRRIRCVLAQEIQPHDADTYMHQNAFESRDLVDSERSQEIIIAQEIGPQILFKSNYIASNCTAWQSDFRVTSQGVNETEAEIPCIE